MKSATPIAAASENAPRLADAVLAAIVAGVTLLRATYIETPHLQQQSALLKPQLVSLLLSTILFACAAVWLFGQFRQPAFRWRRTWLGIATIVFVAAGLLSVTQASDKRAAMTDLVTLTAPIAAAMLLVQWLTTRVRIRLLLFGLLSIGAAAAAVSADQYFSSNEALIADYQEDSAAHLQRLNIEPGSLEQWMYEHRLFSKGVRGFLLTSNSTATYFLLVVFAGIGLCAEACAAVRKPADKLKKEQTLAAAVAYALVTAIAAVGLLITQSKGGIASFLIGLTLFLLLAVFGRLIWKRRRLFGVFAVVLIAAGIALTIAYGLKHNRLPGGNSMLVRWQYWTSAAEMIADHPLTGVGGGNFSIFYPAYKFPAASETVQDPHSWPLSLLAQYGPPGLLAILAALGLVLYQALHHRFASSETLTAGVEPAVEPRLKWLLFGSVIALLLVARPLLIDVEFLRTEEAQSAFFGYVLLYGVPALVFAGIFLLLTKASASDASVPEPLQAGLLDLALVAGIVALLIHNLIDFAIFEPGVWGSLWMLIAILAAGVHNRSAAPEPAVVLNARQRIAAMTLLCAASVAGVIWAVVPPFKADALFNRALRSEYNWLILLQKSVVADPLSPDAAGKAAGLLSPGIRRSVPLDENLLSITLTFAQDAHLRSPADFKPLRLIAQIYSAAAERSSDDHRTRYLEQALGAYRHALDRYPGSDRMHFEAAQIAEVLGQTETALEHYKAAVQIEDAFRAQFKVMYPDRQEAISRLGQTAYKTALQKIEELSRQLQEQSQ
jgi:O-antigen ligase/tetratricopeptide (TPR) repeat protein